MKILHLLALALVSLPLATFGISGQEITVEQPAGVEVADGGNRDFGTRAVGGTSFVTFIIRNTGAATLSVGTATIDGADATSFTVLSQPSSSINPGASTQIYVRFQPQTLGEKTAALHLPNDDSDENPFDITLAGTCASAAPEIALEQPEGVDIDNGGAKDFGSALVGQPVTLAFTIKNTGSAPLNVTSVSLTGADVFSFSVPAQPASPVPAGGSTTFDVRFSPSGTGSKTATLQIANNDSDENPFEVILTGEGVAGVPEIAVEHPAGVNLASGDTRDFGDTPVAGKSDLSFTIKNPGTADLTLSPATLEGADAASFGVAIMSSITVPPGGAVPSFIVSFSPQGVGSKTATLSLPSNDSDENPFIIKLTGNGIPGTPEIAIETAAGGALGNNDTVHGKPGDTFGFTIKNLGNTALTVGTITVDSPADGELTFGKRPAASVAAGGSTQFTVRFPTVLGGRMATVQIANNDADESPFTIHFQAAAAAALPTAADAKPILEAKLREFAAEEGRTATQIAATTTFSARSDNLVDALFQVTNAEGYFDIESVKALAGAALDAGFLKGRADKDVIAPRLLDAALLGSGLSDAADVAAILSAIANARLTAPGKQAVVGRALALAEGGDPAAGAAIAVVAQALSSAASGATAEAKLQTFTIAALKATGGAAGQVQGFMGRILEFVTTDRDAFARRVAEAVGSTLPVVAGEVIGARAAQLAGNNEAIKTLTVAAITNVKLAKAIGPVVAATAEYITGDLAQFAGELADQTFNSFKNKPASRGAIASGILQNVTSAKVGEVIDRTLTGKPLASAAELSSFAGAAATGTGNLAGDVVARLAADPKVVAPTHAVTISRLTEIGKAAVKSIAATPASAALIAQELIDTRPEYFQTGEEKFKLAGDLAKALQTYNPSVGFPAPSTVVARAALAALGPAAAGSAVAGVGTRLGLHQLEELASRAIIAAPKAAQSISKEVSALLPAGSNYRSFAANVAGGTASAYAPAIAAGVAMTAREHHTITDGQITDGQSAGQIVLAVGNQSATLQGRFLTIAQVVAQALDEEQTAEVGGTVSAVLGTGQVGSKIPKLTTLGTLAISLTKAINSKPPVPTGNRVDEIAELCAELTRQAILRSGPNATSSELARTIANVGTNAMKGLGSKIEHNGGVLAPDLKDAAGEIAGAIAQTVSVMVQETGVPPALAARLSEVLQATGTGSLRKLLATAARTHAGQVTAAFDAVLAATGKPNRLVIGTRRISNARSGGPIDTTQGRYEIGSVIDPETPFPRLP